MESLECQMIRNISHSIRRWIEKQPAVKEESITDSLLYQISEITPNVKYKAFTRTEEAKVTGADWEWWFVYPEYSFKMRVQAKKLSLGKDHYSSIAYTNHYGLQIDKLIIDATTKNYAPFYAFYTAETGKVLCEHNINDEGVYLAGARKIYNSFIETGKKAVASLDILALSNALSCWFCCPNICHGHSVIDFLRMYYPLEIEKKEPPTEMFKISNHLGFHKETPNYVKSLLDINQKDIPDWWEREFSRDIDGANAILICDKRKNINEPKVII